MLLCLIISQLPYKELNKDICLNKYLTFNVFYAIIISIEWQT